MYIYVYVYMYMQKYIETNIEFPACHGSTSKRLCRNHWKNKLYRTKDLGPTATAIILFLTSTINESNESRTKKVSNGKVAGTN